MNRHIAVGSILAALLFTCCFSNFSHGEDDAATKRPGMLWPEKLKPGDTIMIVAPASETDRDKMMAAKRRLEQRGFQVKMRDDLFDQLGYLAGSDERRAEELMQAFLDEEVDAVFSARGGYGTMRILDKLDYDAIRAHPKIFTGYSDITALHMALNNRAGLVTFHAPSADWSTDADKLPTAFTRDQLFSALLEEHHAESGYLIEIPANVSQPVALGAGKASGRLTGGNLSLVTALMGTPYEIDTEDAILLIEDTREAPYRIDRMLCQLRLAGKLAALRGAVLGQFTENYDREKDQLTDDQRFSVDGVLHQYFDPLGIPVLMNYPVGHHEMNATLPLGGLVEIDADAATLRVLPQSE